MSTTTPATKPPVAELTKPGAVFPDGFVSPFTRVEMQPGVRIDDGLCCVAMLTKQPVQALMQQAYHLGVPEYGPAWIYPSMLISLLNVHDLVGVQKEATVIDQLPDVALITADYNPETEYGRWVLWHHIRGTETQQSFNYVIDPNCWGLSPFTKDFKGLLTSKQPIYYIEVTPKPVNKGKAK